MAIGYTRREPGLGKQLAHGFLGGAASSLGQKTGEAISGLVGAGAGKLGELAGLGGPDKKAIAFWVSQGYSPEEAKQVASQPIQIQQQLMKEKGSQKRSSALAGGLSGVLGGGKSAPSAESGEAGMEAIIKAAQEGASEQDIFNLLKAQQGQQKIGQQAEKIELARHKATAPIMKEYADQYKAAKKGEHTIERMKELDKEDLAGPGEAKFAESIDELPYIGRFIRAFTGPLALNPASQEFQKLQSEFLTEMRSLFGGNIPVAEMQQFMKGIPTLMNTKEGRARIYKNLEYGYKIKKQAFKIAQEIKRENGGKVPLDIDDQVTERLGKKMKKIAAKIDFSPPKAAEGAPVSEQAPQVAAQSAGGPGKQFVPYEHSMRNTLEDMF